MPDRKSAPQIRDAVDYSIALRHPEIRQLSNQVNLYKVQAGTEEVVQIEWVFKAGNWFEQQKNVAAATNFLIKNGTNGKTAYDIN